MRSWFPRLTPTPTQAARLPSPTSPESSGAPAAEAAVAPPPAHPVFERLEGRQLLSVAPASASNLAQNRAHLAGTYVGSAKLRQGSHKLPGAAVSLTVTGQNSLGQVVGALTVQGV